MPEPERHPLRPPILPAPLDQLAQAPVTPMRPPSGTLNPDNPSVEAVIAVHALQIAALEKKLETIEKLLIGALVSALGAFVSAAAHILMHTRGL